ncbi:hypothetical protein ACJX0J_024063, partial [Zea mays]
VINSYIYLLIAQGHMKQHPSGTVHVEITFVAKGFEKANRCSWCGLFLLNCMEYWTRVELPDNFTQ